MARMKVHQNLKKYIKLPEIFSTTSILILGPGLYLKIQAIQNIIIQTIGAILTVSGVRVPTQYDMRGHS